MFISFQRILKFGFQGFWRHQGLTLQVIFIMGVAIFTLTSLFIFQTLSDYLIARAQEKVDISVYFKREVPQEEIFRLQENLSRFSQEIESVSYISEEKAKEIFIQRHQNDPLYLQALQEIGNNPFLASLKIKAKSPAFYAQISEFLTKGPFGNLIEKISYYHSKRVIEKLLALTSNIQKGGVVLSVFLIVLVFLITFNTIKLTIFALREEIFTMRLVGASNWFIKGPFLVQGVLYGIFSLLLVDLLLIMVLALWGNFFQKWLFDFNLLKYFKEEFLTILFWQFIFAIFLAGVSSLMAVRKYLKI